jgi:hypothetical protein
MGRLISESRKNTAGRRKIFSLILGVLCLANLIGLLFAGLWPFDFSPENKAVWVSGGKGLFFDGKRKPWKRSVGSIANIPTLKGFSNIPTTASRSRSGFNRPRRGPEASSIFFLWSADRDRKFSTWDNGGIP